LAYFTDSESVANTFTVGNIDIQLDEAVVNQYGEPLDASGNKVADVKDADRTQDPTDVAEKEGNNYKLVPGRTYVKDPTMTVAAGSEPAYIRMLVTISHIEVFDAIFDAMDNATNQVDKPELTDIFNGHDNTVWEYNAEYRSQTTTPGTITYEFRYYDDSKADNKAIFDARTAAEDIKLPALFDSFTVPGFFGSAQIQDLDGMTITVIGQAIQADTFADENAAWDAFDDQVVVNNNYKSPYANTATP
jgi:hypothetical protein